MTLSHREMEVLALLCDGLSNREIGDRLHIEEETVKCHMKRILRVLRARNRTHAAVTALRMGIVQ